MMGVEKVVKFTGNWKRFKALLEVAGMEFEDMVTGKETTKIFDERKRKDYKKSVEKKKKNCLMTQPGKRRKMTIIGPQPQIPPLLTRRIEEIAGVETAIVWLNAKELTVSDVEEHLDRLFIPKTEALRQFLSKQDIKKMHTKNKTKVVDPEGDVWDLIFTYWEGVNQYVFTSKWFQLVAKNRLQAGEVLQVWSFRRRDNPCFAINRIQRRELLNADGANS